jgi:hypothetical protein
VLKEPGCRFVPEVMESQTRYFCIYHGSLPGILDAIASSPSPKHPMILKISWNAHERFDCF